jgi:glycerol uptake operon antiterminator
MSRLRSHAHGSSSSLSRHEPGEFRALVQSYPVIPAVRAQADLSHAVQSSSRVVYLLAASLSTLDEYLQALRSAGKEVIVNLDLFAGLSRDSQAVAYLASSGCAGIISTHTDVLGAAQSQALYAVQRTFLIDSDSVTSCMRSMRHFLPDALELLPAPVAPRILPSLRDKFSSVATVGGGLIADLQEADALIRQGLDAVSSGNPALWRLT